MSTVTFQIRKDNETQEDPNLIVKPKKDKNGKFTGTFVATCTDTGAGANSAELWTITVDKLPMFSDESGMLYGYTIDEQNTFASSSGDNSVYYIQKRIGVESDDSSSTGTAQTFSVNLENTVAGTKTHTAYKYWKDKAVAKEQRPQLTYTLYRYRAASYTDLVNQQPTLPAHPTYTDLDALPVKQQGDIGFEKVDNSNRNDEVLTAGDGTAKGASGQPYDWKIDIEDLPRFDALGREYVYVLREHMSNNGENVFGTYEGKSVRTVITSGQEKGEYDEFTNTIRGTLTLSGAKVWKGHESYSLTLNDLPEPWVTLYRTTDTNLAMLSDLNGRPGAEITERDISSYLTSGQLSEVDRIQMKGENRKKHAFPVTKSVYTVLENGKLMLPKYDENGQRYKYLMRERLLDDEGNHTTNTDIADTLYAKTSNISTLVNTLKKMSTDGPLQFTKVGIVMDIQKRFSINTTL